MSKKTAVVQTSLNPGGAALVSIMQAQKLDADLYCSKNNLEGAFEERTQDINIIEYRNYFSNSLPLSDTLNAIALAFFKTPEFLKGYEAVITHKNPAEILGMCAKQRYGCRFIWYGHNISEFIWAKLDEENSRLNSGAIHPIVKIIYRLTGPLLRKLDKEAFNSADKIFTNSEKTKKKFQNIFDREIDVLYPPIRKFDTGHSEGYVLTMGRVSEHKETHMSVKSCAETQHDLIVVGKVKSEDYNKYLEEIAENSGIKLDIRGFVSDEELKELIAHCKFGILPAAGETFGLTSPEIVYSGKPGYVREGAGAAEIFPNEWIYSNEKELVSKIEDTDDKERKNLVEKMQSKIDAINRDHYSKLKQEINRASGSLD